MGYLKQKHNTRLILDPTYPNIDHTSFHKCNWKEFYGDVQEPIPPDMPRPLGKDLDLCMMVDSDHAGESLTAHIWTNDNLADLLTKVMYGIKH